MPLALPRSRAPSSSSPSSPTVLPKPYDSIAPPNSAGLLGIANPVAKRKSGLLQLFRKERDGQVSFGPNGISSNLSVSPSSNAASSTSLPSPPPAIVELSLPQEQRLQPPSTPLAAQAAPAAAPSLFGPPENLAARRRGSPVDASALEPFMRRRTSRRSTQSPPRTTESSAHDATPSPDPFADGGAFPSNVASASAGSGSGNEGAGSDCIDSDLEIAFLIEDLEAMGKTDDEIGAAIELHMIARATVEADEREEADLGGAVASLFDSWRRLEAIEEELRQQQQHGSDSPTQNRALNAEDPWQRLAALEEELRSQYPLPGGVSNEDRIRAARETITRIASTRLVQSDTVSTTASEALVRPVRRAVGARPMPGSGGGNSLAVPAFSRALTLMSDEEENGDSDLLDRIADDPNEPAFVLEIKYPRSDAGTENCVICTDTFEVDERLSLVTNCFHR
ncbi:hypothetical protein HK101_008401 [Irineochytrium annulatum]|nr:hypothetical protein HK101_008401 [Irineochytrium annulatum]